MKLLSFVRFIGRSLTRPLTLTLGTCAEVFLWVHIFPPKKGELLGTHSAPASVLPQTQESWLSFLTSIHFTVHIFYLLLNTKSPSVPKSQSSIQHSRATCSWLLGWYLVSLPSTRSLVHRQDLSSNVDYSHPSTGFEFGFTDISESNSLVEHTWTLCLLPSFI